MASRINQSLLKLISIIFISIFSIAQIDAGGIVINDKLKLDGAMRWRSELDGKDFSNNTAMNELSYLRTRLGLDITAIKNTRVYIQIQDSRNLGTNSSGLTNDTNLGLHQGYISLQDFLADNLYLQVGRFEAVYGRERLLGAVGWNNVGRTFDGARISYSGSSGKTDFFSLKINDRSFDVIPDYRDWILYGFYGTFMQNHLDLFFLFDWDMVEIAGRDALQRYTTGLYYKYSFQSGIKIDFDFAYQGGKQVNSDISSFMIAGDISYPLQSKINNLGFGFDVTSGDDDLSDNKIKYFNNLYYTGHKFRGYMDLFVGSSRSGLLDLIFRLSAKPLPEGSLNIDIHHFQTLKDYTAGQEIDLTGKYDWQEGLSIQGGASLFFPSDDWIDDADIATWFYLMMTASF
jgi:hypothetical protein